MTDIEKVEEWTIQLLDEAFESGKEIGTIPKFPVKLPLVDAHTFNLVFKYLFEFTPTKISPLKEIQRLITSFIISQAPKDQNFEDYSKISNFVNGDVKFVIIIAKVHSLIYCKAKFKDTPEANLIKNSSVKKITKPIVVKSEDNNYRVFMYAKSNGQSKTAEKFNLPLEEVKIICAAQRSLKNQVRE